MNVFFPFLIIGLENMFISLKTKTKRMCGSRRHSFKPEKIFGCSCCFYSIKISKFLKITCHKEIISNIESVGFVFTVCINHSKDRLIICRDCGHMFVWYDNQQCFNDFENDFFVTPCFSFKDQSKLKKTFCKQCFKIDCRNVHLIFPFAPFV